MSDALQFKKTIEARRKFAVVASPATAVPTPGKPGRLRQLDGLRGVAMLFVFMGHFSLMWAQFKPDQVAALWALKLIDADATFGSSFFMLLSGFFVYGSMRQGRNFGVFLRGRLRRLYPLYLVMTAVYVAGSILLPNMSKLPRGLGERSVFLIETLLFLPGLLPRIRPLMDVAWTLSFIVLFYFITAGCARIFNAWPLTRALRLSAFVAAAVIWALLGQYRGWWEPRTAIFWVGMALSESIQGMAGRRGIWATRLTVPAFVVSVFGFCLRTYWMIAEPDLGIPLLLVRFVLTSMALFAFTWVAYFGPEWWKRLLSAPQLCRLGTISYSYYLTHGLAIKAFRYGILPALGSRASLPVVFWASQPVALVLSILIAETIYRRIENPLAKVSFHLPAVSAAGTGNRAFYCLSPPPNQ